MYKGIKEFIKEFKEPFDRHTTSLKKAKERLRDRGEKATELAVKEEAQIIIAEWDESIKRGEKLHKQIQEKKTKIKNCIVEGWESNSKKKGSPDPSANILKNNTNYIEKRVVSEKYKLSGYSDDIDVVKNFINIEDTKTGEIYKTSAIKLKTGFVLPPTYFFPPLSNLQDCNFNEIALQMSLYMYILWTHNKHLKPGKMHIRKIVTNSQDKIIEEKLIKVPYLRDEVKAMLKNRLQNAL